MERIVIDLGKRRVRDINGTRQISIPKLWLSNVGIDVGDEVELSLTENRGLLVMPANRRGYLSSLKSKKRTSKNEKK